MAERKNEGKLRWKLLVSDMTEALEELIKVRQFGAEKYKTDTDWKTAPYFTRGALLDSMMRHQAAIEKGELHDEESGLLHSAHVACNAMFQLYYDIHDLFAIDLVKPDEDVPLPPFLSGETAWLRYDCGAWKKGTAVRVKKVNHMSTGWLAEVSRDDTSGYVYAEALERSPFLN